MNGGRVRDAQEPEPKCLSSTGELIDIERVTISLEGGRWKSTRLGNSLAAYPTACSTKRALNPSKMPGMTSTSGALMCVRRTSVGCIIGTPCPEVYEARYEPP